MLRAGAALLVLACARPACSAASPPARCPACRGRWRAV